MNKTWIIDNVEKFESVLCWLNENYIHDADHVLKINLYSGNRSVDANALYWKWLTAIGEFTGESKDEVHERYKEKYLVRIYERDDPQYAEMIQAVRKVYKADMKDDAKFLFQQIVKLTSTTTATVKQFREYLQDIEHDCNENHIYLPHRGDDEYLLAMGVKN